MQLGISKMTVNSEGQSWLTLKGESYVGTIHITDEAVTRKLSKALVSKVNFS